MRSQTLIAAAIAIALTGGAATAMADNEVHGTAAWDRTARTIWVNGRESYYVPENMNTVGLRNADRVTLTWVEQDDRRVVQNFSATSDDGDE